jgi:filamentous hemagglutinin family protein
VTTDGSLGPVRALAGPNYQIGADLGQIHGSNLFHSFSTFNLISTESANFTGPDSISNVLGRVTGGSASSIDGAINSQIPGANLYLINPDGIVFGPNATLNVSGSFHASTADYIRLGENARFDASNPGNSVLTAAPPAAFGFLGQSGAISVDQSVLKVASDQTLSLVGGDVSITGMQREVDGETIHPGDPGFNCGTSCLRAPGGRIQIVSTSISTEVPTDLSMSDVSDFTAGGDVTIANSSLIDVSSGTAGSIYIRAGAFTTAAVELRADSSGSGDAAPVAVDIVTGGNTELGDTVVGARSEGSTQGGSIRLQAQAIELRDGTHLETGTCAECEGGTGGAISLLASDTIVLAGIGHDGNGVTVQTRTGAGKHAGDITITAGTELHADAAEVSSTTVAAGDAGSVILEAQHIQLENGTQLRSETGEGRGGPGAGGGTGSGGGGGGGGGSGGDGSGGGSGGDGSGGGSGGDGSGGGSGGDGNGGESGGDGGGGGSGGGGGGSGGDGGGGSGGGSGNGDGDQQLAGKGGDLIVRAGQSITLRQEVNASANTNSSGNAGDVHLEAPVIQVLDGSRVGSNADASGDSGSITIIATDALELAGTNGNPDPARNRGSRITVGSRSTSTGNAGSISITAANVLVADGARVSSSTSGVGAGGPVVILASEGITLRGARLDGDGSSIRASTEVEADEAGNVDVPRNGNAGAIDIQTTQLSLEPGTEIVSSTSLPGEGGRIALQVNQLNMSGATIQTTSTGAGSGDAGDIDISAQTNLKMTDSSISTSATQADGGNIKLTVADTVYLLNSDISARVQGGAGNGGNINIDPVFVVLNGSNITADAFGGNGGNIQIIADFFLSTPDSSVTASSALGINGSVDIKAPDADVSGSLTALPATFLDASALLRSRCGARIVQNASSFVVTGPGALPIRPEDPQPSLYGEVLGHKERSPASASAREPVTWLQVPADFDTKDLQNARFDCSKQP